MSVVRVIKNKDYTAMANYHLKEKEMSLKAIGLLSIMLSLPENWDYSVGGLSAIRKESRNTINEILKELEKFGYLNRTRIRDEKGKIVEVEYTIYESPYLKNQDMDNRDMENQDMDFKAQLNTNIINNLNNKELNNNKEIYKESWECDEYVKHLTKALIEYLNEKVNRAFKSNNPKTTSLVRARLRDGFKETDFINVIETKSEEWLDTEMEKYLRPDTLFGTKFENYVNQRRKR